MNIGAVERLKKMATDPFSRKILIKDDSLIGGLIMVLSNPDSAVVETSLEALILLAEHDKKSHLKNFLGMQEQLEVLKHSETATVRQLSIKLQTLMKNKDRHGGLRDRQTVNSSNMNTPITRTSQQKKQFFLRSAGNAKTVILQVYGMEEKRDMDICRNQLLKVRGVVSITFDLSKRRAVIRVKNDLKVELLAYAVSQTGSMSAEQVTKTPEGHEVLTSFGAGPVVEATKENQHSMPDYLPDEDSPVKHGALARVGGEQREGGGWFKSAANFLTNSFYW